MKGRMASLILGIVIMFTVLGVQLLSHNNTLAIQDTNGSNLKSVVEVMKSRIEKITTHVIWMN
jgi:hypothetical protein